PGPFLRAEVARRDEENFLLQLEGGAGLRSLRNQQHHGFRFVPAGEVVEVLVLMERRHACGYFRVPITEKHDDAVTASLAHQARAPLMKNRKWFALPSQSGKHARRQQQCQQQKIEASRSSSLHGDPQGIASRAGACPGQAVPPWREAALQSNTT